MKKNLFVEKGLLLNESDVEQFFVIKLLTYLEFPESSIKTKKSLKELKIGRGSKYENYKPDYVCIFDKKPKIVIDAKSPTEKIDNYSYQVSGYALGLNSKFKGENPVRYTILTNGINLNLYNWDEEEPILTLTFEDFTDKNRKFKQLVNILNYDNIIKETGKNEISVQEFFKKPSVEEVKSAFNKCHNIIWKKEKTSPTDAFYEFTKIIFVKLNEDKRIREIIEKGTELKKSDFKFSVEWLEDRESETENPLSSIMFLELQNKLQELVETKKKKPIFVKGEGIELKTHTIKEVVKVLQNYDLYTIDEDLNGRMFETFLNATIRGRELGQYFTPRKIVKFMTKLADLKVSRKNGECKVSTVLDACCGSGGFLIDVLADLTEKVKMNASLKPYRDELLDTIKLKSIFGIDANPKISRIARINMYVHGDGGSRIFCADSLDKDVSIHQGTNRGLKKELTELNNILNIEKERFDVVLSNPPFSMTYKTKDKDEKKILQKYKEITCENGTNKIKNSVKSNVLFIARYFDLLKEGGKMFIILDNSVLNSYTHKEYRNYIRDKFIIKAVFQLPTHTFVNQEAGGITSILFLEKRFANKTQEQPPIFARNIEYIGHSTSGKEEEYDEFKEVLKEYDKYEDTGNLYYKGKHKINSFENDNLFLIEPSLIEDRIDIFFYQPSYRKLIEKIKLESKNKNFEIKKLIDFEKVKTIDEVKKKDDFEETNDYYKYLDIGTIDKERGFIINDECEEGIRTELPNRAKLYLKENDVLFAKPFRSLKKVFIVNKEFENQLGSNGFYGIRCSTYEKACLIWSLFRSDLIQKQLLHICTGYTQRELNEDYLKKYLLIPIPNNSTELSKNVAKNITIAINSRQKEINAICEISESPINAIFSKNGKYQVGDMSFAIAETPKKYGKK